MKTEIAKCKLQGWRAVTSVPMSSPYVLQIEKVKRPGRLVTTTIRFKVEG